MPELPEVETIRADLAKVLKGRKIETVEVRKPKIVLGSSQLLRRHLAGQTVKDLNRRGKMLIVTFRGENEVLLIHLKMTGQLIYRDKRKQIAGGHPQPWLEDEMGLPVGEVSKHTHIVVDFTGGARLLFNDLRQFGWWRLAKGEQLERLLAAFGPEPLTADFTWKYLRTVLHERKTSLKNALLDQRKIAGLGNIYVDEACFAAGIRPTRQAGQVTEAEVKRLHRAIERVLKKAIAMRGTTFGTYRDGLGQRGNFVRQLKVYGRGGEKCRRKDCRQVGAVIKHVKVGGRGTAYCPNCQR